MTCGEQVSSIVDGVVDLSIEEAVSNRRFPGRGKDLSIREIPDGADESATIVVELSVIFHCEPSWAPHQILATVVVAEAVHIDGRVESIPEVILNRQEQTSHQRGYGNRDLSAMSRRDHPHLVDARLIRCLDEDALGFLVHYSTVGTDRILRESLMF